MEWKDLAPWIAIAITLALSILVPFFTQIANNKHQRKMQKEKLEFEQSQNKLKVFEIFLLDVGGIVGSDGTMNTEGLNKAASSLHSLYLYAPIEWYKDIDELTKLVPLYKWEEARPILERLSKQIAKELNKTDHQEVK